MVKEKIENEENSKDKVSLGEVPTQYGIVFNTPDGQKGQEDYLVWMGNLLLEVKNSLVGN